MPLTPVPASTKHFSADDGRRLDQLLRTVNADRPAADQLNLDGILERVVTFAPTDVLLPIRDFDGLEPVAVAHLNRGVDAHALYFLVSSGTPRPLPVVVPSLEDAGRSDAGHAALARRINFAGNGFRLCDAKGRVVARETRVLFWLVHRRSLPPPPRLERLCGSHPALEPERVDDAVPVTYAVPDHETSFRVHIPPAFRGHALVGISAPVRECTGGNITASGVDATCYYSVNTERSPHNCPAVPFRPTDDTLFIVSTKLDDYQDFTPYTFWFLPPPPPSAEAEVKTEVKAEAPPPEVKAEAGYDAHRADFDVAKSVDDFIAAAVKHEYTIFWGNIRAVPERVRLLNFVRVPAPPAAPGEPLAAYVNDPDTARALRRVHRVTPDYWAFVFHP